MVRPTVSAWTGSAILGHRDKQIISARTVLIMRFIFHFMFFLLLIKVVNDICNLFIIAQSVFFCKQFLEDTAKPNGARKMLLPQVRFRQIILPGRGRIFLQIQRKA